MNPKPASHNTCSTGKRAPLVPSHISARNKLGRLLWQFACLLLFRPTLRNAFAWRRFVLRCFGAKIGKGAAIYASARIWAPWNLSMEPHSCLGDYVDCYNPAPIRLGVGAIVSQYTYLCTATHDFNDIDHPLVVAPITIGDFAWVTADCFISPGTEVGQGAVVLARSTVLQSIPAWEVWGGSPARKLSERKLTAQDFARKYGLNA